MQYELKIRGESDTILLGSLSKDDSVIKRVDFLISQVNLETNDRSENLFHTLVIEGELKDRTKSDTKKLLDWSLETEQSKVYKTVTLIIKKDVVPIRNYFLKDMYCVSYEENFREDASGDGKDTYGGFVLKMRQRKGSIESIVVEDN